MTQLVQLSGDVQQELQSVAAGFNGINTEVGPGIGCVGANRAG